MKARIDTSNHPLVSIIVPIYNSEKYLSTCLDSILNQTYQNLEILLIDDGSTDYSSQIIKKYAKKDPRIKAFTQKNQGQSAARNQGLSLAKGDYISFIDSDDEINPHFIEKLLAPLQDSDSILSICGMHRKYLRTHRQENLYLSPISPKKPKESFKTYILRLLAKDGRLYSSVNKLYLSKYAKTLRFDTSLQFAEDTKFVLDYLSQVSGSIAYIKEPLYVYNFGAEESTIKKTATNWQNWQISYKYLKSWVGPHPQKSEAFWLKLILLRWRISYFRSKARAKN